MAGLIAALVVVGLWLPDSLANTESDCVNRGAVPAGETALAADCEILLAARNVLLGTATLGRSAETPIEDWEDIGRAIDDWDELRYNLEEAVLRKIAADPSFETRHYYYGPASLNWASDVSIEDWDGITVGGTPRRVVGIRLDSERLGGRVPKELGDLSGLEWLDLGRNELIGPIPSELGNLSNLTSLQLNGNELRGPIPAELGDLSNLTELYLDINRLTGEIPHSFTNLTDLTDFQFSRNAGLCAPTDETFRAWLQSIKSVDGNACDFAADRAVLVKLFDSTDGPNWLRNHGWLSDQPMGEWYGVDTDQEGRVASLYLSQNGLSGQIPAELGDLSNLRWMRLRENQLSGPVPSELGDLSNLGGLFLSQNQLSGPVPGELGDLSNLEGLSLSQNQLSGQVPPELGDLPKLLDLNLGDNHLSGEIPQQLGNLSKLQWLDLADNQLSGQIPSELGNLSRLGSLDLGGNQLSGQIPSELGNLRDLLTLYLDGNRLSGEIPQELGDLSNLSWLRLSENQLTGELPESLVGLSLRRLDFYNNPTLCAPVDEDFQSWLEVVDTVHGSSCAPVDSQEDRAVLALLHSATDGENWNDNSNWLSDRPLREWHGVTSDADGRVTGLYLSENLLSGSIPQEMGDLSQLEWLDLQQNQLTGDVPRSFLKLANLSGFYFSDNAELCAPVDTEFQSWLQGIAGAEGGACNPVADLNVLTRLYNATAGENWDDNYNWLSDRPLREWYGVDTDDEGHVTVLDLRWNGLRGTIPPELVDLSNLEELDLYANELSGTIPRELGNLPNLTKLSLAYNNLTGEIPPELGNLSDLAELDLWRNDLTGTIPTQLGNLSNLTSLWLTDNQLTGEIPTVLEVLSNLENLGLSDNQLTGEIPPELGNLSNLDYLGLGDNQLTGTIPPQLGRLTNLTWLRLWNNHLTGTIPRSFTGLTRLTRLEFWDNAGLCSPNDEAFQAWLQGIDEVYGEACDFAPDRDVLAKLYNATDGDNWKDSSNWLTDRPMGAWHGVGTDNTGRVRWLDLGDNQLKGAIPPVLEDLSNLSSLDLSDNQLTGAIPTVLGGLSHLRTLRLERNQLTGAIPTVLGDLSHLRTLRLEHNQLTGAIPTVLGGLSHLRTLRLEHNQLTGPIPSELGNLSNLEWLDLDGNQLTGSIPTELGNLSSLEWLELDDNQITGTIPPELGNLSRLSVLFLSDNQLSGSVPSELGDLTSLSALVIDSNKLTGELPDSLTDLTQLYLLTYHNNIGLCAPVSGHFQAWLQGMETVLGSSCAPVDSQEDRAVLALFYNSTDGANWENNSNWLSDRPIREWHGVTNDANGRITGLYLSENRLSGPLPSGLGSLSEMRRLYLRSNQLTGPIPLELGSLTNLISLIISDNRLTGSIPPELGNLSNLEWLELRDNQLTGSIPPELGNLSNLTGITLSNNQFTGCIPALLQEIPFFHDLYKLGLPTCGIPAVTISSDLETYQVRIDSPVAVSATFSEPVYEFTASDIAVTNGDVGNFSGSDGDSVFTFDVTPNAIGAVTVDIAAWVAESFEGNGNTAAEQLLLGLPYDDDHDGAIGPSEVLLAVRDYFLDRLSAQHVLQVVALYFQSSN